MNQRLVTFLLALAALALCYALILPKPQVAGAAPARPLTTDAGPGGYEAAWRWLRRENVPLLALRERFDTLAVTNSPRGSGSVMLTTLPHLLPVRPLEASHLDAWIESGNTLIVAAALDDTPSWAITDGPALMRELSRLTRMKFSVINPADSTSAGKLGAVFDSLTSSRSIGIEPRGMLPLMQGVHALKVGSDLPASRWEAASMDAAAVLEVGQVTENGDPAIWVRQQGRGQVITLGVAGLFSNRDLGLLDNARLLSNIIAWNLGSGGRFIFDDMHQGAAKYYDAKAFFADARLHRTLVWLIVVWFFFVLGVQRLAAPIPHWRAPDVTAFVTISGEFLASTMAPNAAGARLLTNFFNAIRRRLGLAEDGTPLWHWLSSQAAVRARDIEQLREMHSRIAAGQRTDLPRLHNLLIKLQGKIL